MVFVVANRRDHQHQVPDRSVGGAWRNARRVYRLRRRILRTRCGVRMDSVARLHVISPNPLRLVRRLRGRLGGESQAPAPRVLYAPVLRGGAQRFLRLRPYLQRDEVDTECGRILRGELECALSLLTLE